MPTIPITVTTTRFGYRAEGVVKGKRISAWRRRGGAARSALHGKIDAELKRKPKPRRNVGAVHHSELFFPKL